MRSCFGFLEGAIQNTDSFWYRQSKYRALAQGGANRDGTPVQFDNPFGKRQPEPESSTMRGSCGISSKESLKNIATIFLTDAYPIIFECDLTTIVLFADANMDAPSWLSVMDGVLDKIEKSLA